MSQVCTKDNSFPTRASARKALKEAARRGKFSGGPNHRNITTYKCSKCGSFHFAGTETTELPEKSKGSPNRISVSIVEGW